MSGKLQLVCFTGSTCLLALVLTVAHCPGQDLSGSNGNTFVVRTESAAPGSIPVSRRGAGWYPWVIARPGDRHWIESMPIEKRPNRPLHFYGNAVRSGRLPHGPLGRAIFGQ